MDLKKGQHIAATMDTWSAPDVNRNIEEGVVNLGYAAQSS